MAKILQKTGLIWPPSNIGIVIATIQYRFSLLDTSSRKPAVIKWKNLFFTFSYCLKGDIQVENGFLKILLGYFNLPNKSAANLIRF